MTATTLLDRLDRARQTGPGTWSARCPAHADKSPSLSIRELDDGRVLLHCFTGCDTAAILHALGLEFADLYPPKPIDYAKPERRPFPASDVLRALANEVFIVLLVAGDLLKFADLFLNPADLQRLETAVDRIATAARIAGGSRHG